MPRIVRLNPLIEALRSAPGTILKMAVQRDSGRPRLKEAVRLAREQRIPLVFVPRETLDRMSSEHQGVVAELALRAFDELDDILSRSLNPFLVVLDEIADPQNLGAVLRTAEAAGVDGVVIPERRAAGITEAVYRVSAGAAAHVAVARVKNLGRAIEELRSAGVWIVGAEGAAQASWTEFDYRLPVALVFGSEGRGLRESIRKKCDEILSLPLSGKVNSLNVASAAAVFIFEVVRQRRKSLKLE